MNQVVWNYVEIRKRMTKRRKKKKTFSRTSENGQGIGNVKFELFAMSGTTNGSSLMSEHTPVGGSL
jgi:hypothetical protein